ncbi:MAG TPA: hypothetical protein PK156_38430, partial [Polyangium sp.]|nr:hypothetical protein [Polyangium sp.]
MKRLTGITLGFVLFVLLLNPREALADPTLKERLETWLREADLFHEEYRQDLDQGLAEATAFGKAAATNDERALALIAGARMRRLRGEFKLAEELLDQAIAEHDADPLTYVRIAVEKRWVEVDRIKLPWGSVNETDEDLTCGLASNYMNYQEKMPTIQAKLHEVDDKKRADRDIALRDGWTLLAASEGDYGTAQRVQVLGLVTRPWMRELPDSMNQFPDALKELKLFENRLAKGAQFPHERLQPILDRFNVLLSVSAANSDFAIKSLSCASPAVAQGSNRHALLCAEAAVFGEGPPEALGIYPAIPSSDDNTYKVSSTLWDGDSRLRARNGAQYDRARAELERLESYFAKAGSPRLAARAAFVRAADATAVALNDDSKVSDAQKLVQQALKFAEKSGDHVLVQRIRALSVVVHGLLRDSAAVAQTTKALLEVTRSNRSYGFGLGMGRLFAAITAHRAFVSAEPASAECMQPVATSFYQAVGGASELVYLMLRNALIQEDVGALRRAREWLREGLTIESSCKPRGFRATVKTTRVDLILKCIDIDDALGDSEAMATDLATAREMSNELAGGSSVPTVMIEKGAQAELKSIEASVRLNQSMERLKKTPTTHPDRPAVMKEFRDNLERSSQAGDASLQIQNAAAETEKLRLAELNWMLRQDRATIINAPLLRKEDWYARVDAITQAMDDNTGAIFRALAAARRDMFSDAQRIWRSRAPSSPTASWWPFSSQFTPASGVLAKLRARHELEKRIQDALTLASIHDFEGASTILRDIEKNAGQTWYDYMQRPASYLELYVDVESGLGNHVKALTYARDALQRIESNQNDLFDERHRVSGANSRSRYVTYESTVRAAVQANDPSLALEFMERGKARTFQAALATEKRPELAKIRQLAQALVLMDETIGSTGTNPARYDEQRAEYEKLLQNVGGQSLMRQAPSTFEGLAKKISAAIPKDSLLLEYFLVADGLAVVALTNGQAPMAALSKISRSVLEGHIRQLNRTLSGPLDPALIAHNAGPLAEALFPQEPILRAMQNPNIREIILVPHSMLHEI